jgi:hypothetical protein
MIAVLYKNKYTIISNMTPTTSFSAFSEFAHYLTTIESCEAVSVDYMKENDYGVVFVGEQYNDSVKELFNCYTTHLVTRKYSIEKIKELRMESIIDNYIHFHDNEGNFEREMLRNHYKNNVCDSFDKKLNPPKCFFAQARREVISQEIADKKERDTDEIADHYKTINDKYKYMYLVSQQSHLANCKNDDDSDILSDHNNHNDYEEDYSHTSYNSDYYDDDYFSDSDSDYNSD